MPFVRDKVVTTDWYAWDGNTWGAWDGPNLYSWNGQSWAALDCDDTLYYVKSATITVGDKVYDSNGIYTDTIVKDIDGNNITVGNANKYSLAIKGRTSTSHVCIENVDFYVAANSVGGIFLDTDNTYVYYGSMANLSSPTNCTMSSAEMGSWTIHGSLYGKRCQITGISKSGATITITQSPV